MVNTVSPKAKATPRKPMPRFGKAAASTALPHPPKTSQKVPTNSAAARLDSGIQTTPFLMDEDCFAVLDLDLLINGRAGGGFYPDGILAHREHELLRRIVEFACVAVKLLVDINC